MENKPGFADWAKQVRLESAARSGQAPEKVELDEAEAQRCFNEGMSPDQFLRYDETKRGKSQKEGKEARAWLIGVVIFLLAGLYFLGIPQLVFEAARPK